MRSLKLTNIRDQESIVPPVFYPLFFPSFPLLLQASIERPFRWEYTGHDGYRLTLNWLMFSEIPLRCT